jgi:hypothetical protein
MVIGNLPFVQVQLLQRGGGGDGGGDPEPILGRHHSGRELKTLMTCRECYNTMVQSDGSKLLIG